MPNKYLADANIASILFVGVLFSVMLWFKLLQYIKHNLKKASGSISLGQVNLELKFPYYTTISMNQARMRPHVSYLC